MRACQHSRWPDADRAHDRSSFPTDVASQSFLASTAQELNLDPQVSCRKTRPVLHNTPNFRRIGWNRDHAQTAGALQEGNRRVRNRFQVVPTHGATKTERFHRASRLQHGSRTTNSVPGEKLSDRTAVANTTGPRALHGDFDGSGQSRFFFFFLSTTWSCGPRPR